MYIQIQKGQPVPITLKQLREANPNTSFRADYPADQLAQLGVFAVVVEAQPLVDYALENVELGSPELLAGVWTRRWEVTALSLDERRARASLSRGEFCLKLLALGILSAGEAVAAARGQWPASFDVALEGMPEAESGAAQIEWANSDLVHYDAPSLQRLAILQAGGDPAGALAVLDSIFGLVP
jgi:hypothetical protein